MGKWTDEQCDWFFGHKQCLDDLDHIDNENGGHHTFDLSTLRNPVHKPVLVRHGTIGLKQKEEINNG